MADEALASFQSLLNEVPRWIVDLENILSTCTSTQTALIAAEQPVTLSETSLPSQTDLPSTQPTLLHEQIPHLTRSDMLRLSQRKRKTASVCSKAESQPNKYRSRSMVAIFYDGDAQKAFETLVRAIGTSRNSIRKGKLSIKLDSLSRSGSSGSRSRSSSGEETIKGLGTFTYRTTTTLQRPMSSTKQDATAAFDKVDGALEKAQALCERAAHQVLRDGDCSDEISKAKEQFLEAIEAVKIELPSLTKKAERALAKQAAEDQRANLQAERRPSHNSAGSNDGCSFPSDGLLEVDSDEVASDSESDGDVFNISTMKLPPRLTKFGACRPQLPTLAAVH